MTKPTLQLTEEAEAASIQQLEEDFGYLMGCLVRRRFFTKLQELVGKYPQLLEVEVAPRAWLSDTISIPGPPYPSGDWWVDFGKDLETMCEPLEQVIGDSSAQVAAPFYLNENCAQEPVVGLTREQLLHACELLVQNPAAKITPAVLQLVDMERSVSSGPTQARARI